jgi:molybdate transport system ATP-binding protein
MIEIDIIKPLYTADGIINLKVNKKINKGDFLTLFGKSGSGKTTLLRILAGLETPKSGKIVVDKEIWFDSSKKINLAPQKRDVGFVFQDYALFPNMSVKKNANHHPANRLR